MPPAAQPSSSIGTLAAGFIAVLLLMVVLIAITVSVMTGLEQNMRDFVETQNQKRDSLARMHSIVRERSLSMYAMMHMDDPFAREQEYMRFHDLAGEFIDNRDRLFQLGLSASERAAVDSSLALIRRTQPLQQEIVQRIVDEMQDDRMIDLVRQDIPLETDLLQQFDRMLIAQGNASNAVLAASIAESRGSIVWLGSIGAIALLSGMGIAILVITRSRRLQDALQRAKDEAEVTLNSIADGVITVDSIGRIRYMNPNAQRLTGWTLTEARDQPLHTVYSRDPSVPETSIAADDPPAGDTMLRQRHLRNRGGESYVLEENTAPLRDPSGQNEGAVLVFRDVTRAQAMAAELSWQATHDPLTGLANRHQFDMLLAQLIFSARTQEKQHALLYIDLDQFKVINDTCGHRAGDTLLQQLASLLVRCIRDSDTLARLGGDEFGVLLDGCPEPQAVRIAGELLDTLRGYRFGWDDKLFSIGASIGLVMIDAKSPDAEQILSAADSACYMAKEKGRNRWWVHQSNDDEIRLRQGEMRWVERLQRAVDEDRLCLFWQRIDPVCASPEATRRYEILVRLREGDQLISPGNFLPAAERYGLMKIIDRWVITRTLDWLTALPPAERAVIHVSINISGASLHDSDYLEYVSRRLDATPDLAAQLCFEITETVAITNWNNASQLIRELGRRGSRFALDDFGSGMSSFGYLKHLPVNYIKIDGAFIRNLLDNPVDQVTVKAISQVSHELGIETIAEWVENGNVMDKLRELSVSYGQGYFLHRPEPVPIPVPEPVAALH